MQTARDIDSVLSNSDYQFICQFVYSATGIVLKENKREMVYRRLARIKRERKLGSFSEYCEILKSNDRDETNYLINAITTNLTKFFREDHHFEYLFNTEFPRLLESKLPSEPIKIWSSACSTGEEPYSIAMTVNQYRKKTHDLLNAKILATDIDSNVLSTAKRGIYPSTCLQDIPSYINKDYFVQGRGQDHNKVKVIESIKKNITFNRLNLLEAWPMKNKFDIIFCRNVIIYFDKETHERLFERYYNMLNPGGLFILGHSESLGGFQKCFEVVGRTLFRKI